MKINVTTRNNDGSVKFEGSLNKAEVNTLLQYAVNNLVALGFIFGQDEQEDPETAPSRILRPNGTPLQ
jgi:hypothetical protein